MHLSSPLFLLVLSGMQLTRSLRRALLSLPTRRRLTRAARQSVPSPATTNLRRCRAGRSQLRLSCPCFSPPFGVAAWIKWQRMKGQEKRKRFSQAIDKRMSTISQDWKSLSAAGASAAIRNSYCDLGNWLRWQQGEFVQLRWYSPQFDLHYRWWASWRWHQFLYPREYFRWSRDVPVAPTQVPRSLRLIGLAVYHLLKVLGHRVK